MSHGVALNLHACGSYKNSCTTYYSRLFRGRGTVALPALAFVLVLFVLGQFLLHTSAQLSLCSADASRSMQSPIAGSTFLCFDLLLFELLSLCLRFTPLLCSRALMSALRQIQGQPEEWLVTSYVALQDLLHMSHCRAHKGFIPMLSFPSYSPRRKPTNMQCSASPTCTARAPQQVCWSLLQCLLITIRCDMRASHLVFPLPPHAPGV